jgi:hypothetical protein
MIGCDGACRVVAVSFGVDLCGMFRVDWSGVVATSDSFGASLLRMTNDGLG